MNYSKGSSNFSYRPTHSSVLPLSPLWARSRINRKRSQNVDGTNIARKNILFASLKTITQEIKTRKKVKSGSVSSTHTWPQRDSFNVRIFLGIFVAKKVFQEVTRSPEYVASRVSDFGTFFSRKLHVLASCHPCHMSYSQAKLFHQKTAPGSSGNDLHLIKWELSAISLDSLSPLS